MKISFIRHTSVAVPQGVCYGQSDVPVSKTFTEEAEQVLQKIAPFTFDGVYTSPLSRCKMLADFCGFDYALPDTHLQELNFGEWELKYWDEIEDPRLAMWYQGWLNQPATGGESFNDLYQRFVAFIHALPEANHLAVFTHGGIINCARVYAKVSTLDTVFNDTPVYGSVTELTIFPK